MSKILLFCFIPEKLTVDTNIILINKNYLLHTNSIKGITAIFKRISDKEYHHQFSAKRFSNVEDVISSLLAHEEVIENIMHYSSVFPVRFGTLFSCLGYLEEQMIKHHTFIKEFLCRSFRHTEWSIKIYLKESQAMDTFSNTFLSSSSSLKLPFINSEGTHYLLEKRMRYTIKQQLPSYLESIYHKILKRLNICATDFQQREVERTQPNNPENKLPLVNNWAFLVKSSHISQFRGLFNQLEKHYTDYGLSFKLTGPWPPYSFCCLKNN